MKYYIVLFDDGCLQIYNKKLDKRNFANALMYECDEDVTIADISEWIGTMYRYPKRIKLIGD